METTRVNTSGSPMYRDAPGRQGGGRLFYSRRERDLGRGLLSARGHGNDYLVFQPAKYFMRILGDRVLRLNEALSEVRSRGAELIPSVGVAKLQTHYAELDRLIEAARDKLAALTDYCNKGFEGRFKEALEGTASRPFRPCRTHRDDRASGTRRRCSRQTRRTPTLQWQLPGRTARTFSAPCGRRHFDQGILTEFGRDQGCVAFQPSPFFGRFLGEIAYSLNDALRRLEGNTSYYVMSGDGDTLQNYYLGLEGSLAEIGRDLDGIIACLQAANGVRWNR